MPDVWSTRWRPCSKNTQFNEADRTDQTVLRYRDKPGRRYQSPTVPADARPGTGNGASLQIHLRLIEQLEFPLGERVVQVCFDGLPFDRACIHVMLANRLV